MRILLFQLYLRGVKNEKDREAEEAQCSDSMRAEMNALAAYLLTACTP